MTTEEATAERLPAIRPDTSLVPEGMTREHVELVKRTVAKGCTDDELALFLYHARRTGLDPLLRQLHAIKRWDGTLQREVMVIQTGIDGYRLTAQRTGEFEGEDPPQWCAADGVWREVWLSKEPPAAARIVVYRRGQKPAVGIARYDAYVQLKKDGHPNAMWAKMPDGQLAKCAEALALRKAFPQELGGVRTDEEMDQADTAATPERPPIEMPRRVGEPGPVHEGDDRPAVTPGPDPSPAGTNGPTVTGGPADQEPLPLPPAEVMISERERQELFALCNRNSKRHAELKAWLQERGCESTTAFPRRLLEPAKAWITGQRAPGQEG